MYTTSTYRGDTGGRFILYQDTAGIQEVEVYYIRIRGGDTGGRSILYQDTGGIQEVEVYYIRIQDDTGSTFTIYLDLTRYFIVLFSLKMILTHSLIKPGFL